MTQDEIILNFIASFDNHYKVGAVMDIMYSEIVRLLDCVGEVDVNILNRRLEDIVRIIESDK